MTRLSSCHEIWDLPSARAGSKASSLEGKAAALPPIAGRLCRTLYCADTKYNGCYARQMLPDLILANQGAGRRRIMMTPSPSRTSGTTTTAALIAAAAGASILTTIALKYMDQRLRWRLKRNDFVVPSPRQGRASRPNSVLCSKGNHIIAMNVY